MICTAVVSLDFLTKLQLFHQWQPPGYTHQPENKTLYLMQKHSFELQTMLVGSLKNQKLHKLETWSSLGLLVTLLLNCFSHVRLRDPIDGNPPGSLVPGILQAKTLEWVAISFSNVKNESEVTQLCATQWPHGLQPARLLRPRDFPGKRVMEWGATAFSHWSLWA